MIAYGSSCDDAGVASASVLLQYDGATSVLVLGDGQEKPSIRAFGESKTATSSAFKIRFLHASPPLGPLDFGFGTTGTIPTDVMVELESNVVFGATASESGAAGTVDFNGYVEPQLPSGTFNITAAIHDSGGNTPPWLVAPVKLYAGADYTVFMIGTGMPPFPFKLWACRESSTLAPMTVCSDSAEW